MTTEPEADITPTATHSPSVAAASSRIGLLAVFGSTFFELCGIFMLSPLLLLLLKQAQISTTVAGLFAATTWLGVFIITPFASQLARHIGRRPAMWLASATPLLATLGFMLTDALWIWFALQLLAGVAGGLRWVLAEAFHCRVCTAPTHWPHHRHLRHAGRADLCRGAGAAGLGWHRQPHGAMVVIALLSAWGWPGQH
jgi:MFS family permease